MVYVFGFEGIRSQLMALYNKVIFLDSSMVEHSAVNRVVVGSSPTRGAKEQRSCSSIGIWKGKEAIRLRGQAVKTSPFHGGNTGSIPVGVTKKVILNRI